MKLSTLNKRLLSRSARRHSDIFGENSRYQISPQYPLLRLLSTPSTDFYPYPKQKAGDMGFLIGEVVDASVDLRQMLPGDSLDIPYELTVNSSIRDFWQSSFHSNDRIHNSKPFARRLGFQDTLLPFGLMLFLTGSMSHADAAKVQVGYTNGHYCFPAYPGDTFTRRLQIKSRRNTSSGENSLFTFQCELRNQRGQVVFITDKSMLFPFVLDDNSSVEYDPVAERPFSTSDMMKHLVDKFQEQEVDIRGQSLNTLRPGQLLLHSMARPLSTTQIMQLSSIAKLTHERHFNHHVFDIANIYVPGGLVLGLVQSASARDLHEVLHEELVDCKFINNLHPGDTVGALSMVKSVEENVTGEIESIVLRTIGVKNLDVGRELNQVPIPRELFSGKVDRPRAYEEICERGCPILHKKIVACVERRILRQAPSQGMFLL